MSSVSHGQSGPNHTPKGAKWIGKYAKYFGKHVVPYPTNSLDGETFLCFLAILLLCCMSLFENS